MSATSPTAQTVAKGASVVLLTLASAQFLMTLDSSVMNVSIASVADDLDTTVTGVQTAITLYTLVMASLMITGGKLGALLGRRRMFLLGCVIYAAGSLTTALAPNLTVLIIGWSGLEGVGASLIMPAVVALVAGNFAPDKRSGAYGLIAAAGAIAVAAGPIIGGAVTTSFSWRWVFVGEVVVVVIIMVLARRLVDPKTATTAKLDVVGSLLSIVGLSSLVFGVLKSGTWGWVSPNEGVPTLLGLSPTIWLIFGGLFVLWLLLRWEERVEKRGQEPLLYRAQLRNRRLTGGLSMFGIQFFMQAGIFFTIPLFLSIVLGYSAFDTGLRLLPLSIGLLITAIGVPRAFPAASPRLVSRLGMALIIVGTGVLVGGLELGAVASIVSLPLFLMGLGVGSLASQLGAITVSAVPESETAEVGGLQNTVTNLGASLGTALVGSVLIAALTTSLVTGIAENPAIPAQAKQQATVQIQAGVPFVSDKQLQTELDKAGVPKATATEIIDENAAARYKALRTALAAVMLVGFIGLFLTAGLPSKAVGGAQRTDEQAPDGELVPEPAA